MQVRARKIAKEKKIAKESKKELERACKSKKDKFITICRPQRLAVDFLSPFPIVL